MQMFVFQYLSCMMFFGLQIPDYFNNGDGYVLYNNNKNKFKVHPLDSDAISLKGSHGYRKVFQFGIENWRRGI